MKTNLEYLITFDQTNDVFVVANSWSSQVVPPDPEPQPFDPLNFPFVLDATDITNLRHWNDSMPLPQDDDDIENLPLPEVNEAVFAIRNLGTKGGWFLQLESVAAIWDGSRAYAGPDGALFVIRSDPSELIDIVGGSATLLNPSSTSIFFTGGALESETGLTVGAGILEEEEPSASASGYVYEDPQTQEKVTEMETTVYAQQVVYSGFDASMLPTHIAPQAEAMHAYHFYAIADGYVYRSLAGHHSIIENYDWSTHGPALKAWLEQ